MRKIVREEIKYSFNKDLRRIVREELEIMSGGNLEFDSPKASLAEISTDESYESLVSEKQSHQEIENIKFSSDPMLNAILAETAKSSKPISENKDRVSEFREMNNGLMTTKDVMPNSTPNLRPVPAQQPLPLGKAVADVREIIPDDRRGRDIPDFLQNILTRDWSNNAEVKKAAQKQKSGPM